VRGRLIVVEGLDGTGKTTLSRGLARSLGAVWMTTPPASLRAVKRWYEQLVCSRVEVSQLFHALGVVVAAREANGHLVDGRDVVMDRYWLSTAVYAAVAGSRLRLAPPTWLVPPADLTIFVTLDEGERRKRLVRRGPSSEDRATMNHGFTRRLEQAYRTALTWPIAGRVVEVDVTGLTIEEAVEAAVTASIPTSTSTSLLDGCMSSVRGY